MYVYTVGVKRRFLPGFKKYKVTNHEPLIQGALTRLSLTLKDGGYLHLADLGRRSVMVYPDYRTAVLHAEAARRQAQGAPLAEG